jgi:hypothetical protein
MTKLAGYCRCLSVIESVIPKSMKTALATILASIVLGMEPVVSRPSDVLQRHLNGSSDLRTATVTGMGVAQVPRLFSNTHSPLLPSLNDTATGVIGSFVSVAQPKMPTDIARATEDPPRVRFIMTPSRNLRVGRTTNGASSAPCVQANSVRRTNHSGFRKRPAREQTPQGPQALGPRQDHHPPSSR